MPDVVDLIRAKRDGGRLADPDIDWLMAAYTGGQIADEQMSALLMAIFFRGLDPAELRTWTAAMIASGERLDLSAVPARTVDKHSTGGVGDKVSLILAPLVASCGAAVPQLSGRGLGHTGGTLDKLESIPGWRAQLDNAEIVSVLRTTGCVICAAGAGLAPADRRLYAIRDATGTVESIPLIVGSILSKKLAAGLDALVMDVKVGSGAFLPDAERARELARAIVDVARGNGLPTAALLTDMDQVLGRTTGNAVEVRESIDHLTGATRDERLREVTLALSAELLVLGGVHADADEARGAAERALDGGAAAERFAAMAAELGGPSDLLEAPERHLRAAPVVRAVEPGESGAVVAVDVRAVGLAVVGLGGGRARESDPVDHSVGFTEVAALGERVGPGERPLALVHARDDASADRAAGALRAAFVVGDGDGESVPIVMEVLR